jgi:hypothetical protein
LLRPYRVFCCREVLLDRELEALGLEEHDLRIFTLVQRDGRREQPRGVQWRLERLGDRADRVREVHGHAPDVFGIEALVLKRSDLQHRTRPNNQKPQFELLCQNRDRLRGIRRTEPRAVKAGNDVDDSGGALKLTFERRQDTIDDRIELRNNLSGMRDVFQDSRQRMKFFHVALGHDHGLQRNREFVGFRAIELDGSGRGLPIGPIGDSDGPALRGNRADAVRRDALNEFIICVRIDLKRTRICHKTESTRERTPGFVGRGESHIEYLAVPGFGEYGRIVAH